MSSSHAPSIEATAQLSDVNQTTDGSVESSNASVFWWREAAMDIIREEHDFNLIARTIKYIPGDPTTTATLLSSRPKEWLCDFLEFLCWGRAAARSDDTTFSTAKSIVTIIRPELSRCPPSLEQNTFITALLSDTRSAAGDLDSQIHTIFTRTTFLDWTAWVCGDQCTFISQFLNVVSLFRENLARSAKLSKQVMQNLELLQKELPTKQPLVRWIIQGAISCDTSLTVSEALRPFLKPIAEQVKQFEHPSISCLNTAEQSKEACSILSIIQRLSILDTRFKSNVVCHSDPDWPTPLSADFSLWESIQNETSQDLAKSSTLHVGTLFLRISCADLLHSEEGYLQDLDKEWSDLADDFFACLNADRTTLEYLVDLANHFIRFGNLFSATAIGLALQKWGYQDSTSTFWMIINPKEYFVGCTEFVADNPACLVPLQPYVRMIQKSPRNAPGKILAFHGRTMAFFQMTKGLPLGLNEKTRLETGVSKSDSQLSNKLDGKQVNTGTTGTLYLPDQFENIEPDEPIGETSDECSTILKDLEHQNKERIAKEEEKWKKF